MASMARHATTTTRTTTTTTTTTDPRPSARFELLEILSDVACIEAQRLSLSSNYHPVNAEFHHRQLNHRLNNLSNHLSSLSSPSTLRSSSTIGHSSSPSQPSLPRPPPPPPTQQAFSSFHLYSSAFVRRAPTCGAPISMVRRVVGNVGATTNPEPPRVRGISNPGVRATLTPPITKNSGGGWKGRSTPSRFCHICSRTAKKVELLACANLASGACRKVVCEKCFSEYNWDWKSAEKNRSSWQCTHCRRVCPRRAQCAIYRRTNERRREQQQAARARLQNNRSTSTHSDTNRGNHSTSNSSTHYELLSSPRHNRGKIATTTATTIKTMNHTGGQAEN